MASGNDAPSRTSWRRVLVAAILVSAAIVAAASYGKLTANLQSENFNIAQALVAGQGYANAIGVPAGPTAWSAPAYPLLQASLLWLGEGSREVVRGGLVVLHVITLMLTAWLVLTLASQTSKRLPSALAAAVFFLVLSCHYWNWFQVAQDCWLILLVLDLLLAAACWLRPLESAGRALAWGAIGGLCALANPSVGFAWGGLCLVLAIRQRAWRPGGIALVAASLTLAPWIVRNYLVFGRLIPVKSNLAYELYQTHCLQSDGLLRSTTAALHPSSVGSPERAQYVALGEAAYLERKWQQFSAALWADPEDFVDRVATRFLGATLWYVPHNRSREESRPWLLWVRRVAHPLPFLALLVLFFTGIWMPLSWPQWAAIAIYGLYLLPYVVASYYERYAVPLDAVKALLILWATDRLTALVRPPLAA